MSWIWRVVVAALVIGGIAYWLPSAPSDTAVAAGANGLPVYAPAAANDNVDPCLSGNPRKQKKCN